MSRVTQWALTLLSATLLLGFAACASKDDAGDDDAAGGGSAGSAGTGNAGGGTTKSLEATVDCVSMMNAGPRTAGLVEYAFTWAPLRGEGQAHLAEFHGDSEPKRCTVAFRGDTAVTAGNSYKAFYGEREAHVFDAKFPQDSMMFEINYGGKEYASREGSYTVTFSEYGKRAGTYDVYAKADDGEIGHFTGKWDYCAYGIRRDCPYNVKGALEAKAHFESAAVTQGADAEPSDCRVLIDEATGGVQVDLEVSIWQGMSVTQLFTAGCDPGNQTGLNANRFTFKTGGWKGPGKYGPFKSTKLKEATATEPALYLPSLYWKTPLTFQDLKTFTGNFQFCFTNQDPIAKSFAAYTQEGSVCEYEIQTDPGHVDISCSNVFHASPKLDETWVHPELQSGPFSLAADCSVEFKE